MILLWGMVIYFRLVSKTVHAAITVKLINAIEWTKGDAFASTLRIQTHVDESAYDFVPATEEPHLGVLQIKWKR